MDIQKGDNLYFILPEKSLDVRFEQDVSSLPSGVARRLSQVHELTLVVSKTRTNYKFIPIYSRVMVKQVRFNL